MWTTFQNHVESVWSALGPVGHCKLLCIQSYMRSNVRTTQLKENSPESNAKADTWLTHDSRSQLPREVEYSPHWLGHKFENCPGPNIAYAPANALKIGRAHV